MTSDKIYIIQKAQQGDSNAMRLVYEEYYQYALDYSHRYLLNYSEAKDVTQDIFIRVFEKIGTYRFESDFGAWLNLVCRNHIISYIRKEKKNKFESLNDNTNYGEAMNDDISENELENYRNNLSVEDLFKLLNQLDEKSRTIFNLYSIEGLTHKEIGLQLGISEGTSKSQLSRARVKLKELLAAEFEERKTPDKRQTIIFALTTLISFVMKGAML